MTPVRKYNFLDSLLFCFVYKMFAVLYLRIRLFALLTARKGNGTGVYGEISFHEFYHFSFYLFVYLLYFHFIFSLLFFTHNIYPHPHPRLTTYTHDPRLLPTTHDPRHSATLISNDFGIKRVMQRTHGFCQMSKF